MAYIDFKAWVKKVNLKAKGVKEIVLEINDKELDGKLDSLADMIDRKVDIQFESATVVFNVEIDTTTHKPTMDYKVDKDGVVSEVKSESGQIEADLDLPPEERIMEKEQKLDRSIIDQFILEGFAPDHPGFPQDFVQVVKRRVHGESYTKLATDLGISSGKIVEMIDDYRKKIAPHAQAWWDWKNGDNDPAPDKKENDLVQSEDDPEVA